ncbi:MAG: hypothetical protein Q8O93_05475 [bacterium]|nr:hypothetical protein [bacterium]
MPLSQIRNQKIDGWFSLLALMFAAAGLILLVGRENWWPDFYSPRFFSAIFFISALAVVLPKHFLKTSDDCKREAVIFLRSAVAFALTANALGELYLYQLYKYGLEYDKLIHFASVFFLTVAFTLFWHIWREAPFKQALKLAVILAIAASFLWEGFEFLSDMIFKTREFGIYGQYKLADTAWDLLSDLAGAAMGSAYLLYSDVRKKAGHDYCRRASGKLDRAKARFKVNNQGV